MSDKQDKRKKKKKYFQSHKKQKTGVLETGLKGILITCNNEQMCVKESYNLLNEFADELFGSENTKSEKRSESSDVDIEAELAEEIKDIKCKKRRFQQVCTMAKGVLFINTTVPDPTMLVSSIFKNVLETGQRKARYILKMKPIVITCKPNHIDIRKHVDAYLEEFAKEESNQNLSYKTDSKIRNNSSVTSSHIQWYIKESIDKYAPQWTVSLMTPQLVVSVDVLRNVCCIGFLKNFIEYRRYNLSETAAVKEKVSQTDKCQDDLKETGAVLFQKEDNGKSDDKIKDFSSDVKDTSS